jgi:nitrous oxidase accessory protein
MNTQFTIPACISILILIGLSSGAEPVKTVEELVKAVAGAKEGDTIAIAEGMFKLKAPLEPGAGVTIRGAGMGKTIITHEPGWKPSTKTLPDPEMRTKGMDTKAFLFRLQDNGADITISDMTLRGPQLHGAIFGWNNHKLRLHHLRIDDFLWTGIRTFKMREGKIHDCEFIDAGGRWQKGKASDKGGITGGAIFAIWMRDFEIYNNRFKRTQMEKKDNFFGIKVRQGKQCRIHHNTINANFSIEMPFENDEDVEIDHNVCYGAVSLPKHAGGPVPRSGRTFRVHHNWLHDTYSIEFSRNGIEIDHNLFDFDTQLDHGNLISGFGKAPAKGPALFHNNMISNPGRGVIWINHPYSNLEVRNNHVITRTTKTPRKDGLFGFNRKCDFKTIAIRDNIFECIGDSRPLFRNEESYGAVVENNRFTNVADEKRFENKQTGKPHGLEKPLEFTCGVNGEYTVKGWKVEKTAKK